MICWISTLSREHIAFRSCLGCTSAGDFRSHLADGRSTGCRSTYHMWHSSNWFAPSRSRPNGHVQPAELAPPWSEILEVPIISTSLVYFSRAIIKNRPAPQNWKCPNAGASHAWWFILVPNIWWVRSDLADTPLDLCGGGRGGVRKSPTTCSARGNSRNTRY